MGWRITQQRKMGLHGDLGQLPGRVSLNSWWGGVGSWTWFRLWFYSHVNWILCASELFSRCLWCVPSPEFNLPRSFFCYHYKTISYKNASGITVERSLTWVDPTTICLHRPGSWRGQTWINTTPGRAVPVLLRCATPYQQEGNVSLETSLKTVQYIFFWGVCFLLGAFPDTWKLTCLCFPPLTTPNFQSWNFWAPIWKLVSFSK